LNRRQLFSWNLYWKLFFSQIDNQSFKSTSNPSVYQVVYFHSIFFSKIWIECDLLWLTRLLLLLQVILQ
jgi:hypothetical protein